MAERLETVAGVSPASRRIKASVVDHLAKPAGDGCFPLSVDGIDALTVWLRSFAVRKVALPFGGAVFPWQRVDWVRRSDPRHGVDLEYWLEIEGPNALDRIEPEVAWQPILLALRPEFDLFVVKPDPSRSLSSNELAASLAKGDFAELYPKSALERVIEGLAQCTPEAVEEAVAFFILETRGYWHNRARAKIARRLKHCSVCESHSRPVIQCIVRRLVEGDFTEQFRDQLGLLVQLDRQAARTAGAEAVKSEHPHVARLGHWLEDRLSR